MNFIDDLKRLQKIHQLISNQNTGSPDELADTICVSRSELYYILRELKKMGAKISYNRCQGKRIINQCKESSALT